MFQLPRIESGSESFELVVPDGLRLSLVDLAVTDAVPLATAELVDPPAPGATGRHTVRVRWSHTVPLGRVAFRLTAYASPDGKAPAVTVGIAEPASDRRIRRLFEQDAAVDLAVTGDLARQFHDHVVDRGGSVTPLSRPMVAGVDDATIAAIVVVSLAVIAAICIALGLAVFGAVLFYGLSKGYNVDDAGYKVAVGQGDSRQEHQMVFKLRQPGI